MKSLALCFSVALLMCGSITLAPKALFGAASDSDDIQPATPTYVYWTNNNKGSIGRATTSGTDVNESFIKSTTGGTLGGAGLTMNSQYLYWTSANGGSATTILRAKLGGTDVDKTFITGLQNPCGVAVNSTNIYWGGDVGTTIGRAKLDGSGVDKNFIASGSGVCGVAVTSTNIYWANYRTNEIGRASLDGKDVNLKFIPTVAAGSLAIQGSFIYWPSENGTSIGRANIDGKSVNQNFIKGLNGQVAFIAADSTYIYWADWGSSGSGTTIGRAKLNGTGVDQTFIKGTAGGFGIAVTGGNP